METSAPRQLIVSLFLFKYILAIRLAEFSLGSAAISPSGERIAVMNLCDGIDFYSATHREFISTTKYAMTARRPRQNLVVDIVFVDEDTVAFGHSDGYIGFASYGFERISGTFKIEARELDGISTIFDLCIGIDLVLVPIQTICFGITQFGPLILGLVPSSAVHRHSNRYASEIHIGRIEDSDGRFVVSEVVSHNHSISNQQSLICLQVTSPTHHSIAICRLLCLLEGLEPQRHHSYCRFFFCSHIGSVGVQKSVQIDIYDPADSITCGTSIFHYFAYRLPRHNDWYRFFFSCRGDPGHVTYAS